MKLFDYIKYYIGCEVIVDEKERGVLIGAHLVPNSCNQIYYLIQTEQMRIEDGEDFCMPYNDDPDEPIARIKPILRKIEDMTEEEKIYVGFSAMIKDDIIYTPTKMHFLVKRGFDLWGLIPDGLAIDSKTLIEK